MKYDPVQIRSKCNYLAPDGSEIFLLARGNRASLCECVLPVEGVSNAVAHRTIEELWYFLEGSGTVYRGGLNNGEPTTVEAGTSLVIPPQTVFQFRNTGSEPLRFVIVTTPPWPLEKAAVEAEVVTDVAGKW